MTRYVLIESNTGFVWGDTANIDGRVVDCASPLKACEVIDHWQREYGHAYVEHSPHSDAARKGSDGYLVYTAREGQRFPFIHDGQDKADIDAVQRNLTLVAFVETVRPSRDD